MARCYGQKETDMQPYQYQVYVPHRFGAAAQRTVDQANTIIADFADQGYTLSLRQLYYQFVKGNLIPNDTREYKRLGRVVKNGREAGLIAWDAIEDRGRTCYGPSVCEDEDEAVSGLEYGLRVDMWRNQDSYLEVWVEKDALGGVVGPPCSRRHVRHMACKGFLSASESWSAGKRFKRALATGKHCVLVHLADHDPSGLDMTRDNAERLALFSESLGVEIRRIALNMDQVEEHDPPPNPAKETDSRYTGYVEKYGPKSWELDALPPSVVDSLITDTIEEYVDEELWQQRLREQEVARRPLKACEDNWRAVRDFMQQNGMF